MKKYDVAEKSGGIEVSASKPYYPTFRVTEKKFPPIKGKKIGRNCVLEVDAKVVTIDLREGKSPEYVLEIRKIGLKDGTLNEKEFLKLSGKEQEDYMEDSVK